MNPDYFEQLLKENVRQIEESRRKIEIISRFWIAQEKCLKDENGRLGITDEDFARAAQDLMNLLKEEQ